MLKVKPLRKQPKKENWRETEYGAVVSMMGIEGRMIHGPSSFFDYCLLASPLFRVSSAAVDGLMFRMKYPLP